MFGLARVNTLPETNMAWKYPLGKGDSYWKPEFLSAMLVSGSVITYFGGDQTMRVLFL